MRKTLLAVLGVALLAGGTSLQAREVPEIVYKSAEPTSEFCKGVLYGAYPNGDLFADGGGKYEVTLDALSDFRGLSRGSTRLSCGIYVKAIMDYNSDIQERARVKALRLRILGHE